MTKTTAIKPTSIESKALAGLGKQANAAHRRAAKAGHSALEHALECGRLLAEAKGQLKHGQWLPWLEAHFEGSRRWATGYMRLYAGRELLTNGNPGSHLSMKGGLKLLAEAKKGERNRKIETRKADRAKAAQSAPQTPTIHLADGLEYDPGAVKAQMV